MSIEKLVQQLEHQPKTIEEHFAAKRDEWIADVAQLMSDVTAWLSPAIEKCRRTRKSAGKATWKQCAADPGATS